MEKDKLEKAAQEYVLECWDAGNHERMSAFKDGAEWLMEQPLSERLTEEERDKIKGFYEDFYQRFLSLKHRDSQMAYYAQCNMITFEEIFGKEMFEPKE